MLKRLEWQLLFCSDCGQIEEFQIYFTRSQIFLGTIPTYVYQYLPESRDVRAQKFCWTRTQIPYITLTSTFILRFLNALHILQREMTTRN